ncbi:MAG TPA: hypothetical protein PLP17_16840, partial [Oligoflexia bacterium]|nr:hypothetical protein [Oligoflexia bacterium]
MLNVTVKSGPALRAMDHHAAQLVQLVHSVFQEAPWSFSWALGTPADKPASRQCTAWGFCNILFGNDSDLALLVANGDSPPEELPLHASICGIGAGLPLTEALLPEFDLAGKACTGDYY